MTIEESPSCDGARLFLDRRRDRYLLTLARLAKEHRDAPAEALIRGRLDSFPLGQRDHEALFPSSDWRDFRRQLAEAIEHLRK